MYHSKMAQESWNFERKGTAEGELSLVKLAHWAIVASGMVSIYPVSHLLYIPQGQRGPFRGQG